MSTLVLAPRFRQADYLDMLDQVAGDLPTLERRVVLGPDTPAGAMGWDELRSGAGRVPVERLRDREALLQFDDPINIQYTSGTTGFPKGATLSHHNILNNGVFIGEGCGYTEADRVCIPVPLYHCFGMVLGNLACTTHGAAMVYPAEGFEPEATLAAVQAERCTSLYGVPTMFIAELEHPRFADFDLTSLRTGIMAGSPCPVEVMKKVQADMHMTGHHLLRMTETSPVSFQTAPTTRSTSGRHRRRIPSRRVKCRPRHGRVVPCGTPGDRAPAGTWSARLLETPRPPGRRSTRPGCTPATWPPWTATATPTSSAASRTWSSAAARTSIRASREFLYHTRRSPTCRWWACPTPATARSWRLGAARRAGSPARAARLVPGRIASFKIPRYWRFVDDFPMTVTARCRIQDAETRGRARLEAAAGPTACRQ